MQTWRILGNAVVVCALLFLLVEEGSGALKRKGTYKSPNGKWTWREGPGQPADTGRQSATLKVNGLVVTGSGNDHDGCTDDYNFTLTPAATPNVFKFHGSFVEDCGPGDVSTYQVTAGSVTFKKTSIGVVKLTGSVKTKETAGPYVGAILTESFAGTKQ